MVGRSRRAFHFTMQVVVAAGVVYVDESNLLLAETLDPPNPTVFLTARPEELGVSGPDLRRLTWSKPELLEEAQLECQVFVARAWGVLIEALDSDDPRRRLWAADKILSSWVARDHPLSPARR